jgi:hypothetical protein
MPGISTVVLHADRDVHPTRAVAPPIYTRYGNPNHALVSAGDHVIGQKSTYRGHGVGPAEPTAAAGRVDQPGRPG